MPVVKIDYLNTSFVDTYTDSAVPSGTYGSGSQSVIGGLVDGSKQRTLMKFAINMIPNDVIINSAKLTLSLSSAGGPEIVFYAHEILSAWDVTTVTDNTLPAWDSAVVATGTKPANNTTEDKMELDITSLIQRYVNGDGTNNGIILEADQGTVRFNIYSLQTPGTSYRPVITIDYSIPGEDKTQIEVISSSVYTGASSGTTHSVPMPAAYNAGDTLIAYIAHGGTDINSLTIPSGWTVFSNEKGWNDNVLVVLHRVADKSEANLSLAFNKSVYATAGIIAYRHVLNIVDLGSIKLDTVGSTNKLHKAIPVLPKNVLLTSLTIVDSAPNMTPPLSFTQRIFGYAASTISLGVSDSYNHQKTSYTESELTVTTSSSSYGAMKDIYLVPISNLKPKIDGEDGYLGAQNSPLVKPYTITDIDGDNVTIIERLNGLTINTKNSLGANTFDLTSRWENMAYGDHAASIEVYDAFDPTKKSFRAWTFTKTLPDNSDIILSTDVLKDATDLIVGIKQKLINNTGINPDARFADFVEGLGAFAHFSVNEVVPNDAVLEIALTDVLFKPRFVLVYTKEATAYAGSPVGYASGYMLYPVEAIPSFLQKSLFVSVNGTANRGETFVSDFKLEKGTAIVAITHKRASSISDKGGTVQDIILLG